MPTILQRLADLGITLPQPAAAVAAYVPYVVSGNMVYISGQLPMENGQVAVTGRAGAEVDTATAQKAARLCAINILAQLNAACGGKLEHVERCVKLSGFVSSTPDYYDQPQVINGASEFFEQVMGDAGKHARAAVGVSALPKNATVEIEAIFTLKI